MVFYLNNLRSSILNAIGEIRNLFRRERTRRINLVEVKIVQLKLLMDVEELQITLNEKLNQQHQ